MGGLSWAMLRRHLPGYLGAFPAMALGAALMGGSVALATAAMFLDGVDPTGWSPERQAEAKLWGSFMAGLGGITAFVAILVSVVLVASLVSFVVAGRRRELALLRLSGARPGQLVRMVVGEVALLSVAAGVVGSLLAQPVASGYLALFASTYGKPDGFGVNWRIDPMLVAIALTVLVAVLSALGPARALGKVEPIEALQEGSSRRKPMTWPRWTLGILGFGGALALFLVPADLDPSVFMMLVTMQGFLAVLGLVQLAPVIVAPVSRIVSGLASAAAPGPGALAQGHASWNAARTASLANPALLLVAVPAVFLTTSFGLTAGFTQIELRTLKADAVVTVPAGPVEADAGVLTAVPGVEIASPAYMTESKFWEERDGAVDSHQIHLLDLPSLSRLIDLNVVEGSIEAVKGNDVAVAGPGREMGETITVKKEAGEPTQLKVVAIIENVPSSREVMADLKTFDTQGVGAEYRNWFLGLAEGTTVEDVAALLAQALSPADPSAVEVETAYDYSHGLANDSNKQVTTSVMVLVGGACLLAALAIAVALMTSLRERRAEFALARRAGAQEGAIMASTLIETGAIILVSLALAGAVIALMWGRVLQNFVALGLDGVPPIPWNIFVPFAVAGVVIALVATVAGTFQSLRAIRLR